jgi:hypothetical protein
MLNDVMMSVVALAIDTPYKQGPLLTAFCCWSRIHNYFFIVTYQWAQIAKVLVPSKPLQSSVM